jgi:hypothetical protein
MNPVFLEDAIALFLSLEHPSMQLKNMPELEKQLGVTAGLQDASASNLGVHYLSDSVEDVQ